MREDYSDLMKNGKKNPYADKLKKLISIRLDIETLEYFQEMGKELGIPYQTLINMYLMDVRKHKKRFFWENEENH